MRDLPYAATAWQPNAAMGFAGGFPFNGPLPTVTSANITPDPSGIPYYDENPFSR